MVAVLRDFEAAVQATGGSAPEILELREFLASHAKGTVAQFATKVLKQKPKPWTESVSEPLRPLHDSLDKLHALLVSAGGNKAADDIQKLLLIVRGCEHLSISQFLADARIWLSPAPKVPRSGSSRQPIARAHEDDRKQLAQSYADALTAATADNSSFDEIVGKLRGDKRIRTAEMREIAQIFLGHEIAKKKGRGDALAHIVDRQQSYARQQSKGRLLDRLKPW